VSTDVLKQDLEIIRIRTSPPHTRIGRADRQRRGAGVGVRPSPIGAVVLTSDAMILPPSDFERVGALAVGGG